jgi:hypothetical protein
MKPALLSSSSVPCAHRELSLLNVIRKTRQSEAAASITGKHRGMEATACPDDLDDWRTSGNLLYISTKHFSVKAW